MATSSTTSTSTSTSTTDTQYAIDFINSDVRNKDLTQVGRNFWRYFHIQTISYPVNPTDSDKAQKQDWLVNFFDNLPCDDCTTHAYKYSNDNPVNLNSRAEFVWWGFDFHNSVNIRLNKPIFSQDCFIREYLFDDESRKRRRSWFEWNNNNMNNDMGDSQDSFSNALINIIWFFIIFAILFFLLKYIFTKSKYSTSNNYQDNMLQQIQTQDNDETGNQQQRNNNFYTKAYKNTKNTKKNKKLKQSPPFLHFQSRVGKKIE